MPLKSAQLAGKTAKRMFSDIRDQQRGKTYSLLDFIVFGGHTFTEEEKAVLQRLVRKDSAMLKVFEKLAEGDYHEAEEIINTELLGSAS